MSIILYGIANCDTVKKARKWLDQQGISYQFYDFKKQPLTEALYDHFAQHASVDELINKRSTTYRSLDENIKHHFGEQQAKQQALLQPTLLKRPLLSTNGDLIIGFDPNRYQEVLAHAK
jgi:arsenate reductase